MVLISVSVTEVQCFSVSQLWADGSCELLQFTYSVCASEVNVWMCVFVSWCFVVVQWLMNPPGVPLAWLFAVRDCMSHCQIGSPFKNHATETRFKTPEMAFYWLHSTMNHIFKAVLHKWCETSKHISHSVASCAWCEQLRIQSAVPINYNGTLVSYSLPLAI